MSFVLVLRDPLDSYPVNRGVITDWGDMEIVWGHSFRACRLPSQEHPVLLADSPTTTKPSRERTVQIMFETFGVPAMNLCSSGVLALYSAGRTSGTVVECGDGVTHVSPVYEGFALPHAFQQVAVAGRDITDYLFRMVGGCGVDCSATAQREIARGIKEAAGYVSFDFEDDMSASSDAARTLYQYVLPDGSIMTLKNERFICPEALFQPHHLLGFSSGVHEATVNAIRACDVDIRKDLYSNIVLSGGTTILPGFSERMTKEITALAPSTMKIKVVAPPDRMYSVWIGGSILSSLSTFQAMWISKAEYDESGPAIVHRKCLN